MATAIRSYAAVLSQNLPDSPVQPGSSRAPSSNKSKKRKPIRAFVPLNAVVFGVAGPDFHQLKQCAKRLPVSSLLGRTEIRRSVVPLAGKGLRARIIDALFDSPEALVLYGDGQAYRDFTGVVPDILVVHSAVLEAAQRVISMFQFLVASTRLSFVTLYERYLQPYLVPLQTSFLVCDLPPGIDIGCLLEEIHRGRLAISEYFLQLGEPKHDFVAYRDSGNGVLDFLSFDQRKVFEDYCANVKLVLYFIAHLQRPVLPYLA